MALTPATGLADYASGISTAALQVNSDTGQVSIGTDSPTTARLRVGTAITMSVGVITATDAVFRGNVSIAGTLTYEDVTSIDSVGILTARSGVRIPAGGLTVAGVSSFSSALDVNSELDVDGQTDLDNLIVAGVSTFSSSIDLNGELDVDGQTDLDTLQVAGVSTFAAALDLNAELDVDGQTDLDNLIVAGVSTFSSALDINAGTNISGDLTIADKIVHDGDTNTAIRFPAADTFTVETAGSERVRVTSAGSVGIKTTSPAAPLHVDSDNAYGSIVLSRDGGVSNRRPFGFGISGDADDHFRISSSSDTTGSNAFANQIIEITAEGKVGINTNNPVGNLQINADSEPTVYLYDGGTRKMGLQAQDNFGSILYSYDSEPLIFSVASGTSFSEKLRITSTGQLQATSAADVRFTLGSSGTAGTNDSVHIRADSADLKFMAANGGSTIFEVNGTETVRITGIGSVGINDNDPTTELDVNGDIGIREGNNLVWHDSNGTAAFRIRAGSDNILHFERASGNEQNLTINDGKLLVGTTTSRIVEDHVGNGPQGKIQIEATDSSAIMSIISAGTADANRCGTISLGRHRNSNVGGTPTIVQNGDALGAVMFCAGDGTDMRTAGAKIHAEVDGQPGSNDMPGALIFSTTPDGSSTPGSSNERMKIHPDGVITMGSAHSVPSGASVAIRQASPQLSLYATPGNVSRLTLGDTDDHDIGQIGYDNSDNSMFFATNASTQMYIMSDGAVTLGTTDTTIYNEGSSGNSGVVLAPHGSVQFTRPNDQMILLNRQSSDGALMGFYRDGLHQGAINVASGTVSLAGAHLSRWTQLPGGAERTEILMGTVLSNLDEMCEWGDEDNEQLNRMKVSDVEGDVNVAGVFQNWDDDDDIYLNDYYCAMTGDFVIRIAQGTTVARGDLLMSAGDGTAKPQGDDIVRSKTVAKVTSTTVSKTYSDGSYCVPCVLMAC